MRLVSCVIPTYGRPRMVARAIGSVMNQRCPDGWELELIVVDDGSDATTAADLASLCRGDDRIRLVHRRHTGRPGAVRNHGVSLARGEAVAFLDSDDEWLPGKLAAQLARYQAERPPVMHTREHWLRGDSTVSQAGQRHPRSGDLYQASLRRCIIGPSTVMIDRAFFGDVGGFRDDLEVAEDYELWLRTTVVARVELIDGEALVVKHDGHGDQLSHRYGYIEPFRIEALAALVERWTVAPPRVPPSVSDAWRITRGPDDLVVAARRELVRKCRIAARGARRRGFHERAERYERIAARNADTY